MVAGYKNAKNAIGYSFMYYSTQMIKTNQIQYLAISGVKPTPETVRNKTYPFTVPVYAVTVKSNQKENVSRFLNWVLSDEGQNLVGKTGYVPEMPGGPQKDALAKDDLRLYAYPEKYIETMSSTPGIRISAEYYSGKVGKVCYSAAYGSFLTWNSTSGDIFEWGQYVELPYDREIYWTPSGDNTMPKEMNKIYIKVGILDENEKLLAENEVNIFHDGIYTVQASPEVIIGVKGQ